VPIVTRDTLHFALGYTNFDDFTVHGPNGRRVFLASEPARQYVIDYRHGFDTVGLDFGFERWGNEDLLLIDELQPGSTIRRRTATGPSIDPPPAPLRCDCWRPAPGRRQRLGLQRGFGYLTDPVDMYVSLMYFDYGNDLGGGPVALHLGTLSPFAVGRIRHGGTQRTRRRAPSVRGLERRDGRGVVSRRHRLERDDYARCALRCRRVGEGRSVVPGRRSPGRGR
jgi:hypothetical protein